MPLDYKAVCGWGHKSTSLRARRWSQFIDKPYIAIEDGFLRSVEPGTNHSISLVWDPKGIHYAADSPSRLEEIISRRVESRNKASCFGLDIAEALQRYRLSKYNNSIQKLTQIGLPKSGRYVLVVDQTLGDASVSGAGAGEATFAAMLAAAISENPKAKILVKLHPETVLGKKVGYFRVQSLPKDVIPITSLVETWSLLESVEKVYTVSSQLGFEAVLAGIPTVCFGMPFYAGWGLTDDRTPAPTRRAARPTRGELVEAVMADYPAYFDSYDRTLIDIWRAMDQLAFLRDRFFENSPTVCIGITRWKRKRISQFLSGPAGKPTFLSRLGQTALSKEERLAVWASHRNLAKLEAKIGDKKSLVRIEDGFLRSVGLGAAFHTPISLVFDEVGIYFDSRNPSGFEKLCNEQDVDKQTLERASSLRAKIVENNISKYNISTSEDMVFPEGHRILVVGQVEDDASILTGTVDVKTNLDLLRAVRLDYKDAILVYRPHPDVSSGLRKGAIERDIVLKYANVIAQGTSITALLSKVERVATMTSLTGFEALLRHVKVTTYGLPFYAGWGLTDDRLKLARRRRKLNLDELTAFALIYYPRYVDPISGLPCPAEVAVTRLMAAKIKNQGKLVRLGEFVRTGVALARYRIFLPLYQQFLE